MLRKDTQQKLLRHDWIFALALPIVGFWLGLLTITFVAGFGWL